jgi:hypothetical protein
MCVYSGGALDLTIKVEVETMCKVGSARLPRAWLNCLMGMTTQTHVYQCHVSWYVVARPSRLCHTGSCGILHSHMYIVVFACTRLDGGSQCMSCIESVRPMDSYLFSWFSKKLGWGGTRCTDGCISLTMCCVQGYQYMYRPFSLPLPTCTYPRYSLSSLWASL